MICDGGDMKRKGCSILFVNRVDQILLFLRDDLPGLPYANMWDIPGGHVEEGETTEECIVREMKEEIGVELDDFSLFRIYEFDDRVEYVFLKYWEADIETLILTEGQALRWFSEDEISRTSLAYGFNLVASDYYNTRHRNTVK